MLICDVACDGGIGVFDFVYAFRVAGHRDVAFQPAGDFDTVKFEEGFLPVASYRWLFVFLFACLYLCCAVFFDSGCWSSGEG